MPIVILPPVQEQNARGLRQYRRIGPFPPQCFPGWKWAVLSVLERNPTYLEEMTRILERTTDEIQ